VKGIANAEGGWQGAMIGPNRNGSYDIGEMQINTYWLDTLKGYDIHLTDLNNTCTNIAVGTFILKLEYNRAQNWCDAIAAYNAGAKNLEAGREYARRVSRIIHRLSAMDVNYLNLNC
jgi:soluble lytic murein transglycosylase-like protein